MSFLHPFPERSRTQPTTHPLRTSSFPATASDDLGTGEVEGGLIVPVAFSLPHEFTLGVMAEIDINHSQVQDRYIVDVVHTCTLARPITEEAGAFVEYAGFAEIDGTEDYRGYFNTGMTYALTPDIQLVGESGWA